MKHISSTICGWTLAVAALFAAHVACAEEVTLPDGYVPVNLVTNVGGSASSDTKCLNNNSSYGVSRAFDKKYYSDDTRWIGHGSTFPQHAVWTFLDPTIVDTVRIYNANYDGANQSPSDFTIAGSNDGSDWTTLDTESGVTGWSANKFRTFQFVNRTPYLKYRLEVTDVQGHSRMTITEIELYRVNQASFDVVPSGSPAVGIDSFSMDWILAVEEGSTADAGLVWSTDESFATAMTNSLGTGLAAGTRTASLSGLEAETQYWWKIFATNATDSVETATASFKTTGAPVFGTCSATASGNAATFSVALAEAALNDTLSTAVSVHYGTDGESWTALPLGSSAASATMTGSLEGLDYGTTYQWFALATATMEGGRVLSTSTSTNSFTTLWDGDMYVNVATTNAVEPYATAETAAPNIATALALATDGATIHVAPGLYPITVPLTISKAIRILGDDPDPSRVVVSNKTGAGYKNGNQRVFYLDNANASVANLTMQKGQSWGSAGSSFYITSNGGTVSNCVVEAGETTGNSAFSAGAVLNAGRVTHTIFRKCKIGSNSTSDGNGSYRAAVLNVKGDSVAENCLLIDNTQASEKALTIVRIEGNATMRNCTIVDSGLGTTNAHCNVFTPIYISSANATVQNVVVAGVTNRIDGALCRPAWGQPARFLNGATDADIAEFGFPSATIVGTAAEFFKDYTNGNYTPKTGGPLVNKGANYEGMASVDLAGKKRKNGSKVDIGCYEGTGLGCFIFVR